MFVLLLDFELGLLSCDGGRVIDSVGTGSSSLQPQSRCRYAEQSGTHPSLIFPLSCSLLFPFPPLLKVTKDARSRPRVLRLRFELAFDDRSSPVDVECVRDVGEGALGPAPGLEV